jgi:hypothetical protein
MCAKAQFQVSNDAGVLSVIELLTQVKITSVLA